MGWFNKIKKVAKVAFYPVVKPTELMIEINKKEYEFVENTYKTTKDLGGRGKGKLKGGSFLGRAGTIGAIYTGAFVVGVGLAVTGTNTTSADFLEFAENIKGTYEYGSCNLAANTEGANLGPTTECVVCEYYPECRDGVYRNICSQLNVNTCSPSQQASLKVGGAIAAMLLKLQAVCPGPDCPTDNQAYVDCLLDARCSFTDTEKGYNYEYGCVEDRSAVRCSQERIDKDGNITYVKGSIIVKNPPPASGELIYSEPAPPDASGQVRFSEPVPPDSSGSIEFVSPEEIPDPSSTGSQEIESGNSTTGSQNFQEPEAAKSYSEPAPPVPSVNLRVLNMDEHNRILCGVFIRQSGDADWGGNRLSSTLAFGQSQQISLQGAGTYDINYSMSPDTCENQQGELGGGSIYDKRIDRDTILALP